MINLLILSDTNHQHSSTSQDSFNYFNYFTEVEDEFVRRRGKPMFISPLDWALVESWKNAEIPLHIVLRAINESFDAYEAKGRKYRKVNSIFYCEQTVETLFAEYRLSQVGAPQPEQEPVKSGKKSPPPKGSAFAKETIIDFLNRSIKELEAAEVYTLAMDRKDVAEALKRAGHRLSELMTELNKASRIDDEALEHDLDNIDRMILKAIPASLSEPERVAVQNEADAQLSIYKKKMDKKIYERTVENFIARRLREINRVPRLSLFCI
jgi:hypothetical protein